MHIPVLSPCDSLTLKGTIIGIIGLIASNIIIDADVGHIYTALVERHSGVTLADDRGSGSRGVSHTVTSKANMCLPPAKTHEHINEFRSSITITHTRKQAIDQRL